MRYVGEAYSPLPFANKIWGYIGISLSVYSSVCPEKLLHPLSDWLEILYICSCQCVNFFTWPIYLYACFCKSCASLNLVVLHFFVFLTPPIPFNWFISNLVWSLFMVWRCAPDIRYFQILNFYRIFCDFNFCHFLPVWHIRLCPQLLLHRSTNLSQIWYVLYLWDVDVHLA